jgi:hypothetical protein
MSLSEEGGGKPGGEGEENSTRSPGIRKVLKKRRKKRISSCDKTCRTCRAPCDNPFNPEQLPEGRRD